MRKSIIFSTLGVTVALATSAAVASDDHGKHRQRLDRTEQSRSHDESNEHAGKGEKGRRHQEGRKHNSRPSGHDDGNSSGRDKRRPDQKS